MKAKLLQTVALYCGLFSHKYWHSISYII